MAGYGKGAKSDNGGKGGKGCQGGMVPSWDHGYQANDMSAPWFSYHGEDCFYCRLCSAWVTDNHLAKDNHISKVKWAKRDPKSWNAVPQGWPEQPNPYRWDDSTKWSGGSASHASHATHPSHSTCDKSDFQKLIASFGDDPSRFQKLVASFGDDPSHPVIFQRVKEMESRIAEAILKRFDQVDAAVAAVHSEMKQLRDEVAGMRDSRKDSSKETDDASRASWVPVTYGQNDES